MEAKPTTKELQEKKTKTKSILQDVEAHGGRSIVNFIDLCDNNKSFYGNASSDRRRKLCKLYSRLRNLPIDEYLKRLSSLSIVPAPITLREANQVPSSLPPVAKPPANPPPTPTNPRPSNPPAITFTEPPAESPTEPPAEPSANLVEPPTEKKQEVPYEYVIVEPPTMKSTGNLGTPGRTTTRSQSLTPIRNTQIKSEKSDDDAATELVKGMSKLQISTMFNTLKLDEYAHTSLAISINCGILGYGTEEHPHVIAANTQYPELNQLFDIEFVPNIEVDGDVYDGYHIRCATYASDLAYYDAKMCNKYPLYENRAVLFSVASRSFLLSFLKGHHDQLKCPNTKAAHAHTNSAIAKKDSGRTLEWFLVVFPAGVVIDNAIFSRNATKVKRNTHKLKAKKNSLPGLTQDLHYLLVYWRLGIFGSGKEIGTDEEDNGDNYYDA